AIMFSSAAAYTYVKVVLRHPVTALFPYTTLFRSPGPAGRPGQGSARSLRGILDPVRPGAEGRRGRRPRQQGPHRRPAALCDHPRSEEHTSELQSRENLVCRLLLEKKIQNTPGEVV